MRAIREGRVGRARSVWDGDWQDGAWREGEAAYEKKSGTVSGMHSRWTTLPDATKGDCEMGW